MGNNEGSTTLYRCTAIREDAITNKSSNDVASTLENKPSTLVDIINQLMYANWNNAYQAVENYLDQLGKTEYKILIINLIKICILENDMTFIRPLQTLSAIYLNDFNYNIDDYINDFYFILAENDVEKEELYKEIILSLAEVTKNYQLPPKFLEILKTLEKSNSCKGLSEAGQEIDHNKENDEILRKLVDKKCQELLVQKGVILLGPMENAKRKRIHKIANKYRGILPFNIGLSPNKYIMLMYKPVIKEYINRGELISLGNTAYYEGNYRSCIDYYLKVLQIGKPKAIAFIRLGYSFLYLGDTKKAIDYLTIAQEVSRKEEKQFDFTNLIEELKSNTAIEDKKRYFQMELSDFTESIYELNFDEINSYILETGLDIEAACENLGLTSEQTDIVRLLYAKTYYMQGFSAKGDEFLKYVERKQNKSPYILSLLEEIKKNKKLYLIKRDAERPIPLTLKPIKK